MPGAITLPHLLPDGKVLVVGGQYGSALFSSEIYNPSTGTWTSADVLNFARYGHTATLLPDGKVLVAGGYNLPNYLSSAELYDPQTDTWTVTGSMNTAHYLFSCHPAVGWESAHCWRDVWQCLS